MQRNLFVTQNCIIKRDKKSLKIELEEGNKIVPISIIDNVFIFGSAINLTSGARGLLLDNNHDIFFYTNSYKLQGVLSSTKLKSNYKNRLYQYKNMENLDIAKFIVAEKIEQIAKIFGKKIRHRTMYEKNTVTKLIEQAYLASTLNELLGVEGSASGYMFAMLRRAFEKIGVDFPKREYRPPKDRVNGLLSFTYTLYSSVLYSLVLAEGLDPYIGILHKKRGTHFAFVSDLIEYDRPFLSAWVFDQYVRKNISDDDFDGIYLTYEGRKKFLVHFGKMVEHQLEKSKEFLTIVNGRMV